jgi:hypothetical protein
MITPGLGFKGVAAHLNKRSTIATDIEYSSMSVATLE